MSQIKITINNRPYSVACDDGQEEQLHKLASFLNNRMKELSDSLGQIGDANLLVMAGLLLSDEMSDAYAEIDQLKGEIAVNEKKLRMANNDKIYTDLIIETTKHIDNLTKKIEMND